MAIGLCGWSIDQCSTAFQEVVGKIFPQSQIFPRSLLGFARAVKALLLGAIYKPAGPTFRSIVGDMRLRGNRPSQLSTSPYEQMKIAVTTTTASGVSALLTSYGKDFHPPAALYKWLQGPDGGKEIEDMQVWQA